MCQLYATGYGEFAVNLMDFAKITDWENIFSLGDSTDDNQLIG